MNLQRYPIFRIFLFFCLGILMGKAFSLPHSLVLCTCLGLLALSFITAFTPALFRFRSRRILFGLLLSLFFLNLGILIMQWHSQLHFRQHLHPNTLQPGPYRLSLLEKPREKTNSFGALARIEQADSQQAYFRHARAMVYFQKSPEVSQLNYGSVLFSQVKPQTPEPPQNPYEFDYKNHLALKAVYYRIYLDSNSYFHSDKNEPRLLLATANKLRAKLMLLIDNWQLPPDEVAVSKALLLGYRHDIEEEQLQAFAAAGAMHVLAVSGLHVGILYLMAYYALYFLGQLRYGAILRSLILIALLWSFALLTGLSPSVVRAATMFSFVAVGKSFQRYTSVYNTILASAILLLLIKPSYLFELGFQLSYAAVLGIVWLQPRFKALWEPPNWLLRQLWAIITVSLAAQLATFPLSLYYFHQFPSLFLLSNLLVIPIVTLLMYLGLTNLLLSATGIYLHILTFSYHSLLQIMNRGIKWFESQEWFLIDQIHISQLELILCYVFIVSFFSWALNGGYRKLGLATACLFLISSSQFIEKLQLHRHAEVVVYQIKRHTAIGIYLPGESYFICDSALAKDSSKLSYHIERHWWALEMGHPEFIKLEDSLVSGNIFYRQKLLGMGPHTYSLIDHSQAQGAVGENWIITGKAYPPDSCDNLPRQIIVSGATTSFYRDKWRTWAHENDIAFHSTHEEGAWSSEPPEKRYRIAKALPLPAPWP